MHRDIIERDSNDDSQWEMTMRIPMRFNRLILLRPWFWHTAGPAFGDRPENGRLVYLMFFEQARRAGQASTREVDPHAMHGCSHPAALPTQASSHRHSTNAFAAPYSHCHGTPVSPSTNATSAGNAASARTSLPRITTQRLCRSMHTRVLPTASSWPPL